MVETNGMNLPAASLGLPEGTLRQAQIETANETPQATPPADSFSLASGQEIGGHRILRQLGAGGMGTVYEAEQLETGRRLALKVLSRCIISPELRSRFLREGQIAARVSHPNLVYVFGTEEVNQTPVITMELMAGGTLDDAVRLHGPMPVAKAVDAILQVIDGLEAVAAVDVLHRDIKPANCFVAPDGTIKVGDFGLSVTTCSSEESNLTQEDCYLGTPAYCSPEQIRGDKLDVRSDLYSVGVTLYFLLTGQAPFRATSMVRLLSKVLEREPQSPADVRPEIPQELAQVVMRCLAKQPDARYGSYAQLRDALRPFSSTLATPAGLGLRFLAWAIDVLLIATVGMLLNVGTFLGAFSHFNELASRPAGMFSLSVIGVVLQVLYFAVSEYFWRATPGKALCQVRVASTGRRFSIHQALIRSGLFVLVPQAPIWIIFAFLPTPWAAHSMSGGLSAAMAVSHYLLLLAMCSTMRRRNGFAGLHDLLSNTRVIAKPEYQSRPRTNKSIPAPSASEDAPQIGPFHIIGPMDGDACGRILLARDNSLGRSVWIRRVSPELPPVNSSLRCLCRPGRLHWLNGKRSDGQSWDAYEAVSGNSFLSIVRERQLWKVVRYWLTDLAEEFEASAKDGTFPSTLSLDHIWIDGENRAKLLDFPAPVAESSISSQPIVVTPGSEFAAARQFLIQFAASALTGRVVTASNDLSASFPLPLPLHARSLLEEIRTAPDWEHVVQLLRASLQKPAMVSPRTRLGLLAASLILPVVMTITIMTVQMMVQKWNSMNPDVPSLLQCLKKVQTLDQSSAAGSPNMKAERDAMEIYIAARYRTLILDRTVWESPVMEEILKPDDQRLAEEALTRHPRPSAEEIRGATERLRPFINSLNRSRIASQTMVTEAATILLGTIIVFVVIPTMVSALLFRGGMLMRSLGIAVVDRTGAPAARLRVFFRVVLAWLPVMILEVLLVIEMRQHTPFFFWVDVPLLVILVGGALISIIVPHRGIQDRLAGTYLVPR